LVRHTIIFNYIQSSDYSIFLDAGNITAGGNANLKTIVDAVQDSLESAGSDNDHGEDDEEADVSIQQFANGKLKVQFRSHGRNHTLNLKESRTDLSRLPIKLLGMSSDNEEIVKEKLKVIYDFFS